MRPDTASGATLTMCVSTNASSVSELPRRNSTQRAAGGMATSAATPATIMRMARRGHRHQERCWVIAEVTAGTTTGAGTGGGDGASGGEAGVAALLTVCLLGAGRGISVGREEHGQPL